jgi:hypothetical protein
MTERDIAIGPHVTFSAVKAWTYAPRLRVSVVSAPAFEAGVMGIAMARLSAFVNRGARISLTLQKDLPKEAQDFERTIWCSPFGFLLLLIAHDSFLADKPLDMQLVKKLAFDNYRQQLGGIGKGNQIHWISIDPAIPLPPILPLSEEKGFPTPSDFAELISTSVQRMGTFVLSSVTEQPIASFIYETARNSYEHGRIDSAGSTTRGIRSISLERLIFANRGEVSQRNLPDHLKTYFRTLFNDGRFGRQVFCLSIMDQGLGIQGTLPSMPHETSVQRLSRAFRDGESSKPQGEANRGLGLSNVLFAARDLGALLQIYSAGLFVYQDFLNPDDKYPALAPSVIDEAKGADLQGTVISLFIPQHETSPDQKELFVERA